MTPLNGSADGRIPATDRRPPTADGRSPGAGTPSLRAALVGIGILMAVLCLVELAIPSTRGPGGSLLDTVLVAVFTITGLLAWYRRPHNAIGRLMLLTALALWASGTYDDSIPALRVLGTLTSSLPLALLLHLLLAFPSGRLPGRAARAIVAVAYLVSVAPQIIVALQPGVTEVVWTLQAAVGMLALAATVVLWGIRLSRMATLPRRQLLPFIGYGCAAIAVIGVTVVMLHLDSRPGVQQAATVVQLLMLGGLPVAFLVGLTFGAFGHAGEVAEVAAGISAASVEPALLDALAVRALGDPSARILWTADTDPARFVDSAGRELAVPGERGWWPIGPVEAPVGGLLYDRDLIADRGLVATVAAQLGLAMDKQRLIVELRSAVQQLHVAAEELQTSRRRIVVAADAERRRIAQDLHDGAQQRIVLVGIDVQRMARQADDADYIRAEAAQIAERCGSLLDELRGLVEGLMPSRLKDHGLEAAVSALADQVRTPVRVEVAAPLGRMEAEIESTAYFVIAEALTNAVKHAGAREIVVDLAVRDGRLQIAVSDDGKGPVGAVPGFGLRSLRDRIETLGGTMTFESAVPGGTTLRAEIQLGHRGG
ncbi:sensor histidine kinase [Microbacterium sp. 22303]|uniref:sensor histidine kinase n=1 Tax=Microbacterium sp. 22303 TaxID=3453905 RepID=UPI003F85FA51